MAKTHSRLILTAMLTLLPGLVLGAPAKSAGGENKGSLTATSEWRARMRTLLGNVVELFPLALDEKKFTDPGNREKIKGLLSELTRTTKDLETHTKKSQAKAGLDPALAYSAGVLNEDLEIASSLFAAGRSDQARIFLRHSLSQCLGCHTQTNEGNHYAFDVFQNSLAKVDPKSKLLALAATRQFDQALKEFETIIAAPKSGEQPELSAIETEQVSRLALSIAVRVKEDPRAAASVIEKIAIAPSASPGFKKTVEAWRSSVAAWEKEKATAKSLEAARKLIAKAEGEREKGFGAGDVDYLRASAILHESLRTDGDPKLQAQTYSELASVYDNLSGFVFWDLSERYLEACIRKSPHSPLAKGCFDRYKEDLFVGYTGSSGTDVPALIQKHLAELKRLAEPKGLRNE